VNYYQKADVVKALGFTFEKLFQNLFYLGPLRDKLLHQYAWTGDEVAAYFCEASVTGAKIRPLDVDEFGNIRNWPDRFFGDTMEDAVARTDAHMIRLQSEGK